MRDDDENLKLDEDTPRVGILDILKTSFQNIGGIARLFLSKDFKLVEDLFIDLIPDKGTEEYKKGIYKIDIPLLPKNFYIAYSLDSFVSIAKNPDIDKGLMDRIAAATGGLGAYEFVMGNTDRHGGKYELYKSLLTPFIDAKAGELESILPELITKHFHIEDQELEADLQSIIEFSASVILGDLFPNTDWNPKEVINFTTEFEEIAKLLGSAIQANMLSTVPNEDFVKLPDIKKVHDKVENIFSKIKATEKQLTNPRKSIFTVLEEAGASWEDQKASAVTLASASFETVSNAVLEFLRLSALNPERWDQINSGKANVEDIIYQSVGSIGPFTTILRESMADTQINGVAIPKGSLIIATTRYVLEDPMYSPGKDVLVSKLEPEQKNALRVGWGFNPVSNIERVESRFCKGFRYSIEFMKTFITTATKRYNTPILKTDGRIEMHTTNSRPKAKILLSAKGSES